MEAAIERATYEVIEDPEPYYGEIPGLDGIWATGITLEECRRRLIAALEDWIIFSLQRGAQLPAVDGITIEPVRKAG
jgi:predicted RNase H-like HicB family nuclease